MEILIRKPSPAEFLEAAAWPIWTCEPSSFEWGYADTETCLVLEGEVMVEARGKEYDLGPGDWAVFSQGPGLPLECEEGCQKALPLWMNYVSR